MIILMILLAVILLPILYLLFLYICGFFVSRKKEYQSDSKFYRSLLNFSTAVALKILRIKVHMTGMEKLPTDTKRLLFVSNHWSNFDPIITWLKLKKWVPAFVSKPENFKVPIFGRFIHRCCFMPIDRENPRNAMKTIKNASELLKKDEMSVAIYPEGTRSKTCELLPFHNGVFKIAQRADAPIVVYSIKGTEKIHKNYPFHRSDVYIEIIEILSADMVKNTKTDELGQKIRDLLSQNLNSSKT